MTDTQYRKDPAAIAELTPRQFEVTQNAATEPPFRNEFWNTHDAGIYVDIVSGEPLFSSTDKFDSGTGWPSFTKPIVAGNIVEREDRSSGWCRPRSARRTPTATSATSSTTARVADGGLRYCINSAALRFIPVDELESRATVTT